MSHQKFALLPDLAGALICVCGAIAQVFLGRRCIGRHARFWQVLNNVLAAGLVFIFFCDEENMIPAVRHILPAAYRADWIPAMFSLCSLSMIFAAVALFLRDRLPRFRPDTVERLQFKARREFLRQATGALCVAPAAALATGVVRRKNVQVKEIDLKFRDLPKDLRGLRLLQISDIHIGSFFTTTDLARVVAESNNLRPDIAFITGDLITSARDPLDRCLEELQRLRARCGVWGCMGNHEKYAEVEDYTEARARQLGIPFLRHEAVQLKFGDRMLNLAGVDYQRFHRPYLVGAEELIAPGSFNLLLSHNPDVFPVAAEKGFDLTLAGHTHGGQVNVEILSKNLNVADFFTPYTKGLYTLHNSALNVNSGLGTIGMPVRLGAPPEITLIRLCSS